jgi:hypothetical protein
MRKKILASLSIGLLISTLSLHAQNYGFGTSNPLTTVHISGNFFINQSYKKPVTTPASNQIKNLVNGSLIGFAETDSIGRIYDPSGPRSPIFYKPYAPNVYATAFIPPGLSHNSRALEITVEWGALGDGDSIIITGDPDVSIRIGSAWVAPRTFLMKGGSAFITFISNNDLSVAEGFSIVFRRLYDQALTIPQDIFGNQLFYDANKGSLQMGHVNSGFFLQALASNAAAFGYLTNAGNYSLGAGYKSDAGGSYSFAAGHTARAIGNSSVAMGHNTTASGAYSTAFGFETTANGHYSLATGQRTVASGQHSTTMGFGTQALSFASVSLGRYNFTTPRSDIVWVPSDPALIVGNGTSATARSNILEFYKNGNLLIWGNLFQFSDEKLKQDIKPLTNSLKRLAALKGYNYTWKSKEVDDGLQTGMLAQEVEKVLPELVTKNQKGELAMNYEGLIPHLVEAIKELNKEIAALKNGQEKQSDIAVCICDNTSFDKMMAYPNPVGGQLTVTVNSAMEGKGSLQLFDNNGKLVKQLNVSMQKGKNVFNLILPQLSSGQYELVATWGNGSRRQVSIVKP